MEQKGSILNWRLSLAESAALAISCVTVTLWISTRFQTKEDAAKLEARVASVEVELSNLRTSMNQIAVDVSYIRGRIEPKK